MIELDMLSKYNGLKVVTISEATHYWKRHRGLGLDIKDFYVPCIALSDCRKTNIRIAFYLEDPIEGYKGNLKEMKRTARKKDLFKIKKESK